MRFWSARTRTAESPPAEPARDFAHLVSEGYLVAVSALRLAVKNGIILSTIRDGEPWSDDEAAAIGSRAVDALIAELSATAEHLATQPAAPAEGRSRRARAARAREEAARIDGRRRTLLGIVERLRRTRDDDEALREIALRARDDVLAELLQARLIPREPLVELSDDEQREAIEGVKADLQLLMLEVYGDY